MSQGNFANSLSLLAKSNNLSHRFFSTSEAHKKLTQLVAELRETKSPYLIHVPQTAFDSEDLPAHFIPDWYFENHCIYIDPEFVFAVEADEKEAKYPDANVKAVAIRYTTRN